MLSVSSMCRESARSHQQDVEKGPQLCSRIVLSLNVPLGYASASHSLRPRWIAFLNILYRSSVPSNDANITSGCLKYFSRFRACTDSTLGIAQYADCRYVLSFPCMRLKIFQLNGFGAIACKGIGSMTCCSRYANMQPTMDSGCSTRRWTTS
jgi:hypothetical protein